MGGGVMAAAGKTAGSPIAPAVGTPARAPFASCIGPPREASAKHSAMLDETAGSLGPVEAEVKPGAVDLTDAKSETPAAAAAPAGSGAG